MSSKTSHAGLAVTLLVLGTLVVPAFAAGRGEPGPVYPVRVELVDRAADLETFGILDLDVDGAFDGWARIYINDREREKLEGLGFRITRLPLAGESEVDTDEAPAARSLSGSTIPAQYHTYATLSAELQALDADPAYDAIYRLSSIGRSAQNRELWMVQISDNPDLEEDEPEVLYISSMHGDEVVGKELCVGLINYLLDNYGLDPRVTDLVDNHEIWIMPSMNPDGTELGQRYNANGYDLNRNFPDYWVDPVNTAAGRQVETAAVMAFVASRSIHVSANFHGGALVANYGWDSNAAGQSVFSPMPDPDHPAMYDLARAYADPHLPMSGSSSFPDGVTNGADWYSINGGMQDWGYVWHGKFDITLEVSQVKWPGASNLPGFWDDNLESLLAFLERGSEGLRGVVSSSVSGEPLAATVRLDANPFVTLTDPEIGDYHRYIMPGSYSMTVESPGYLPQTLPVSVGAGPAARYDIALEPYPTDLQPTAARIEDGGSGNERLDPGESAELALTLRNLGRDAIGVSGRLIPTGFNATVANQPVAWPDLAIDASAESNAPYPTLSVDPAAPVGSWVGVAVEWQSDGASGVSEPIFLEVGEPQCSGAAAADVPQGIPDLGAVTSVLDVAAGGVIDSLEVAVDMVHPASSDLVIRLASPAGTEVLLHDRSGGLSPYQSGTYGADLTSSGSLDAFDGESADGTWTLTVQDRGWGESGALEGWSLSACGASLLPTPEIRLRDLDASPGDDTTLTWWPYPGLDSYRVYRSTDARSSSAFVDVTATDADPTDTEFKEASADALVFYLVTGVGPAGEGTKGHFGE